MAKSIVESEDCPTTRTESTGENALIPEGRGGRTVRLKADTTRSSHSAIRRSSDLKSPNHRIGESPDVSCECCPDLSARLRLERRNQVRVPVLARQVERGLPFLRLHVGPRTGFEQHVDHRRAAEVDR